MAAEEHIFNRSGPFHHTVVDWKNAQYRRSVAASLVQGVYVLEWDRRLNRQGPQAQAPDWWEFFNFQLRRPLVDDCDFSVFGVIYKFKPQYSSCNNSTEGAPMYVIAFRGNMIKEVTLSQDLKLDGKLIRNELHQTSRFKKALEAVQNMVDEGGKSNILLAGHSLGSAIAMLAGRNMAMTGIFLEAFLFNPPFISVPIEWIKDEKLKDAIRNLHSLITAGLTVALNGHPCNQSGDPFVALSPWVPYLFVNPADHICSGYIGYFERREKMEEIGAECIERVATQNSLRDLFSSAFGRESEPSYLLPSADLTINRSPSLGFKQAHGIQQWWSPNLHLQSKIYLYS